VHTKFNMTLNKQEKNYYICTYYRLLIYDYAELPYAKFSKLKQASAALKIVLSYHHHLSQVIVCLTLVFKEANSVASKASVKEYLGLTITLDPEHFKLSLDEWTEFTIVGLTTIRCKDYCPTILKI